jgi:pimeloyl-ACP methyl ester carboxylesterase/DNA-binding CsgD family transcriptional regulator
MGPVLEYVTTSDGVRIAYAVSGSGPTLISMPGVPFSDLTAEWRIPALEHAFATLGAEVRLIQYDGRGTGHSQRDVQDLTLEGMLHDLDAVVEAADVDRFALLGFYHSCTHALAFAARHPARVSDVVLFGGSARPWDLMRGPGMQALLSLIDQDWDTFAESAAHAWLGWPDDAEGRLAADWFRWATTPAVAKATLEAATAIDITADLPAISCPVLVLHRRGGSVVPLAVSEELASRLPNAQVRILEGSSASLYFERADDVLREIIEFVRPSDAPSSPGRSRGSGLDTNGAARLTPRELEVLRLIAQGETNDEIAGRLGISVNTVERHVVHVYQKIDARGRADAAAYAVRRGLA